MFHEIRHAWQWNSGFIMAWAYKWEVGVYPQSKIWNEYMEYDARNFQAIMGGFSPAIIHQRNEFANSVNNYMKENNQPFRIKY